MRSVSLFIAVVALTAAAFAQTQAPARVEIPTVPVNPKDVASIDSIVKAFYDTISGPGRAAASVGTRQDALCSRRTVHIHERTKRKGRDDRQQPSAIRRQHERIVCARRILRERDSSGRKAVRQHSPRFLILRIPSKGRRPRPGPRSQQPSTSVRRHPLVDRLRHMGRRTPE